MYICRDCGATFDSPEYCGISRYDEETEDFEAEYWTACPSCGSKDFNETFVCCECGQYVFGDFVELKNGEVYCSDCFNVFNVLD